MVDAARRDVLQGAGRVQTWSTRHADAGSKPLAKWAPQACVVGAASICTQIDNAAMLKVMMP